MTGSTKPSSFLIGVAGGSGSGKTYFAQALQKELGEDVCTIISQDNFYIDQSENFDFDGGSINFDHPDSIDFTLLTRLLTELKLGNAVEIPIYDFATHQRLSEVISLSPTPVIVVDGILIFHPPELRQIFDDLLFFHTPEDLRFQRRLERDVKERGRTPQGVHDQFYKQVKPMHDLFVEPSQVHANTIIKETVEISSAVLDCCKKIGRLR